MKIEVAPERDGRVVITILPEEGSAPEVRLAEKPSPQPKEEPEKAEDIVVSDPELVALSMRDDPHARRRLRKRRKPKPFAVPRKSRSATSMFWHGKPGSRTLTPGWKRTVSRLPQKSAPRPSYPKQ